MGRFSLLRIRTAGTLLGVCVILSFSLNLISVLYIEPNDGLGRNMAADDGGATSNIDMGTIDAFPKNRRQLSQLTCQGILDQNSTSQHKMVYWSDIVEPPPYYMYDAKETDVDEQFLVFDEDVAGWNNKRISFEIFAIIAKLTNRTLVLPPVGGEWFGIFSSQNNATAFSFSDVLNLKGIRTMTMGAFLQQEQSRFHYHNQSMATAPENKTDWTMQPIHKLRSWLREVTHLLTWKAEECLLAIPREQGRTQALSDALEANIHRSFPRDKWDQPLDPNTASLEDRMSQLLVFNQANICFYDDTLQSERYLYFQIETAGQMSMRFTTRLMIWFYQFLFFEDWRQENEIKRWVRDSMRYKDELQCLAARIVQQLPDKFHSLHARHSPGFEYQFGKQPSAARIYLAIRDFVEIGSTIYVATDEPNRTFFEPLGKHYKLFFLGDFENSIDGLPTKYYGMIDQLVAAQGERFFGSWASTFTGFIVRIRGYLSQGKAGSEHGLLLNTFYYNQKDTFQAMQSYQTPRQAWYLRESPMAWLDIDRNL